MNKKLKIPGTLHLKPKSTHLHEYQGEFCVSNIVSI